MAKSKIAKSSLVHGIQISKVWIQYKDIKETISHCTKLCVYYNNYRNSKFSKNENITIFLFDLEYKKVNGYFHFVEIMNFLLYIFFAE